MVKGEITMYENNNNELDLHKQEQQEQLRKAERDEKFQERLALNTLNIVMYVTSFISLLLFGSIITVYVLYFKDIINTPLLVIIMTAFYMVSALLLSIIKHFFIHLKSLIINVITKSIFILSIYFFYMGNIPYAFNALLLYFAVTVFLYTIDRITYNFYAEKMINKIRKMRLTFKQYMKCKQMVQEDKKSIPDIILHMVLLILAIVFQKYAESIIFYYAVFQLIFLSVISLYTVVLCVIIFVTAFIVRKSLKEID